MANRRFEVHEIRHAIVRMRLGDSNRQIKKAGLMGRAKATQLRVLAAEHGWLDQDAQMPTNEDIAAVIGRPRQWTTGRQQSQVQPYAEEVLDWWRRGITAVAIHDALVRQYGFTGAYNSVKRFLQKHKEVKSASIVLDFKPGDVAQVDLGAGPQLVDTLTGEVRKTWFFVMTLAFSRHQYLEFVVDQKVETWLGCHRRAFEFFGGVPAKVLIDNPKCAITKACYHDPEVQRSYAEFAEGFGFLISTCPVGDPKKKGLVESGVSRSGGPQSPGPGMGAWNRRQPDSRDHERAALEPVCRGREIISAHLAGRRSRDGGLEQGARPRRLPRAIREMPLFRALRPASQGSLASRRREDCSNLP
jgi:hypothetical protein